MKAYLLTLVFIFTNLPLEAEAQIELSDKSWSGWHFSVDSSEFQKVGINGGALYTIMECSEEAQAEMKRYKKNKTLSVALAFPSGGAIGVVLGDYFTGNNWTDVHTKVILFAIPVTIVSILLESASTRNLKKAVKYYNGYEDSVISDIILENGIFGKKPSFYFGLKYEF